MGESAGQPLRLLTTVFGDPEMDAVWTPEATVRSWLRFEMELALVQAARELIPVDAAAEIAEAGTAITVDYDLLWERTRLVGYPILPLLEQLERAGGPLVGQFCHWGATTQDVMDTGLALQIRSALDRLDELTQSVGDRLCDMADQYKHTLISARTHAQFAVPTTFGAKMAALLAEFTRHRDRLRAVRRTACQVSMFGAGGTSAAYGDQAAQLRTDLARVLGLQDAAVSWHTARDGIAEAVWVCASVSATCAKMGREFIELSRPEIAEVRESWDPLRGASSTMPQKANPITGEVLVGLGLWSGSIGASTTSVMLAGHERSAGEWQSEWEVVPQAFTAAAASLHHAHQLLTGLHVDADTMGRRARSPEALLTAETVMMRLAPKLGRAAAHHLVYEACREARTSASSLAALVNERLTTTGLAIEDADPESCLGDTTLQVRSAIAMWQTGGRT